MTSTTFHPKQLQYVGVIESNITSQSAEGEPVDLWQTTYSNVRAAKKAPLRSQVSEGEESHQYVYVEKNTFVIMKENRTITPKNMRYVVDGVNHNITGVRNWMGRVEWLALDTETRDND